MHVVVDGGIIVSSVYSWVYVFLGICHTGLDVYTICAANAG